VPDSLASLCIGLLLAITAFGLAWPLADFLVGRSLPAPLLDKLYAIMKEDAAIEEVLSLRATYSGPGRGDRRIESPSLAELEY